jgi:predicted dehydrogenase
MSEIGRSAEEALEIVQAIPKSEGESMQDVPFEPRDIVRVGMIGTGGRGRGLLREIEAVEGAQITAVADIVEEHALRAQQRVVEAGHPKPAIEVDGRSLCERDDVDLVYICTPWDSHTPLALQAMECGKHAAIEVPAATTLEECWQMVNTSERTRRHCMMLENCLYDYNEMLVLNMIRAGRFGTITHGEAAYIHEMRRGLVSGRWRGKWHTHRNGNLYPTHGLGPIARYMDIHRGDRFTRLVSMSSREASLGEYRDAHLSEDSPQRADKYICGDMNVSLMQTALGRTIVLQHDVVTPRPYSRINLIAGTKGTFCDYPPRFFFDGQEDDEWHPLDEALKAEYEHPLWQEQGELARKLGGHGGMDFITNYRLIQCFREGSPPDMDVYDAAAWSAPGPLSAISVAWNNLPLPFPDFTRGRWQGA